MNGVQNLKKAYPWIQTPLVVGAPMRLISLADLAVSISRAGGLGFIGGGTESDLDVHLSRAKALLAESPIASRSNTLPVGVGFINWGSDLSISMPVIQKYRPAAAWFFAPKSIASLVQWTISTRNASPDTEIWVQVGSVSDALAVVKSVQPDVLVVQGSDAGGHGLAQGAGVISLVPEVSDAVDALVTKEGGYSPVIIAAGGIIECRGAAAALALGASGVVIGTRLLASKEAKIAKGYQDEVLRAKDGGQTTVRSKVYDNLRGTTGWSDSYNARGIINNSYTDAMAGLDEDENKKLYNEELNKGDDGWGVEGRLTTYAGTGVGLVKGVMSAEDIVKEVRQGAKDVLAGLTAKL
ncbi:inosine monophosphate dehydrogenase [Pleomassaria siparia CBS 279.74]|uniref:Inosine monophosphate dehydrogenase n=1 Tax=Pleomassaria siparia CBS 279.74 TaxID=1314801 RepID=A0A6G1K7Q6_9PLEO|nr:inosine monophosphate dehydrogenase [Pleomassaria siparia CBS 279.74]